MQQQKTSCPKTCFFVKSCINSLNLPLNTLFTNAGRSAAVSPGNKFLKITKIIKLICDIKKVSYKKLIKATDDRMGKDNAYKLKCLWTKKKLNWCEKISIKQGLAKTIVFYDKFFEKFASIAQFSPFLPLIGGGKTKFAPIYVGDVAKAIVKSLELNNSQTKIYELGGPEDYSFKELMEILLAEIKKKRFLISIPWSFAKFQSYFLQMLPNPLLTPDQVELLKYSNVVSGDYPTLKDLGVSGVPIHSILPKYIYRFRTGGQFG